ncbi:MAG: helicase-associated domain-containing protein, partial [Treponema sp.]|nr:helicase-associated domain-containing protein [Treponema sp.]
MNLENPLIVQGDRTLLLDVHAPLANECRNDLIPFAELERSPEHLHTYRLTPLSLWNATSAGFTPQDAINVLQKYARYDVPQSVTMWIEETASRFGKLRLIPGPKISVPLKASEAVADAVSKTNTNATNKAPSPENAPDSDTDTTSKKQIQEQYLYLVATSRPVYLEIKANAQARKLMEPCVYNPEEVEKPVELTEDEKQFCFKLKLTDRGTIKQVLLNCLWPVKDEIQLEDGEPLDFSLRETTKNGSKFEIRSYQKEAANALIGNRGPGTGFGTIVLPCGAGKTIVGMTIMDMLKTSTLIITTNISAVHQWMQELKDKSNLTDDQIAEYTGENKTLAPVTVATYQILTWRPEKDGPYPHFSLFTKRKWGLIIYDEVHMLPAPVFRVVAEVQAVRRVGLTATLVREDGCEGYVFSLVG